MASLAVKLLTCLLIATAALAADEDSDSGQYNPELYEKPYETPETSEAEEAYTEAAEVAEEEAPSEAPAAPSAAPATAAPALPEVVAAAPSAPAAFPYPLLFAHQFNPLIYSAPAPHFLAYPFPTVTL